MNKEQFKEVLDKRITSITSVLAVKASEYATNQDRLYNFKRAALIANCTPEKALLGMMLKHWVSVLDLIDAADDGVPNPARVDEKIGDSINYLILLEALLVERTL